MSVRSRFAVYIRAMAIVLLIAMFHYVAGYRLIYSIGILYSKEQAKEYISQKNNNSQKLTLTTTEYNSLQWNEEGKEFSFNCEMYDIVSIQKLRTNYIITVYTDNDETEWLTAFHNFEKEIFHPEQSSKGSKSAEDVMSSFQKEFTTLSEFKINQFAIGLAQPIYAIQKHPQQVFANIWHPPLLA
jgi:hypothetical protein